MTEEFIPIDAKIVTAAITPRLRQALAHYLGAPFEVRTIEAIAAAALDSIPGGYPPHPEHYRFRLQVNPDEEGRVKSDLTLEWLPRDPENNQTPAIGPIFPFTDCG